MEKPRGKETAHKDRPNQKSASDYAGLGRPLATGSHQFLGK
jgi:hypothetical protein